MKLVNKYLSLACVCLIMALKEILAEDGEHILDFDEVKELDLTTVKDKEK